MPQPLQPFLHDLVGQVAAPTQVWSGRDGQVVPHPDGASDVTGLLHADVRLLSGIEVRVDGQPGVSVAHRSSADGGVVFTSLLRHLDAAYADTGDPRVRLDRTRRLRPGRLSEELLLASTLDVAVPVQVEVVLGTSTATIEAVRESGPGVPADVRAPEGSETTWTAQGIEVALGAPGATLTTGEGRVTARWDVVLPSRGSLHLGWSVAASDVGAVVVAAPPAPYDDTLLTPDLEPRLAAWLERSLADLAGLRMALPGSPGDVFYAAGAPWYLTLFGRDSLWAARMTLPLGLDVARGTLRTLGRLQGRDDDPRTGEQPGKIPHELRRHPYQLGGMSLPPLYYGTVDATPLWVCLLHDAWRAGLDEGEVAELLPALEAALGWLTAQTSDGPGVEGFVR